MHRRGRGRSPDDALLHGLRIQESCYCQSLLGAPWGIGLLPSEEAAYMIFVAQGRCLARVEGQCLELSAGDFLLLPHGSEHELLDAEGTRATPIDELDWVAVRNLCVTRVGGEGPRAHLVTGSLVFEPHPLIAALPNLIRSSPSSRLRLIHELMAQEAMDPQPGVEVMISRLAEVLVIEAIRDWLGSEAQGPGIVRGLGDPVVGRALGLIHDAPERHWTLEELARTVGASRTIFSERFTTLVGQPPMSYWSRWRMQIAARWLRERGMTVEEVASGFGYSSAASFGRAFKAATGRTPGALRRERRALLQTLNERLDPQRLRAV